jgi:hypothetical protein
LAQYCLNLVLAGIATGHCARAFLESPDRVISIFYLFDNILPGKSQAIAYKFFFKHIKKDQG